MKYVPFLDQSASHSSRMTSPSTGPVDELHHDAWWLTRSSRAMAAVAQALGLVEQSANIARKRARREADQRRFERQVIAYLCDLWRRASTNTGDAIIVSRAKKRLETAKDRYAHPDMTGSAVTVQNALVASGLCVGVLGCWGGSRGEGRRTTLSATPLLLELLPGPTRDDFMRDPQEEVILLRSEKCDPTEDGRSRERAGKLLNYAETPDTERMRSDLRKINAQLEAADIALDELALTNFTDDVFDPSARRLYRIFANGRFDTGGRLYRGFWIGLPKASRQHVLRIDGEPIVMVDYGQMSARLAYAKVGMVPPCGDLYALGRLATWQRDGVKKLMNAALFSSTPLTRRPKGTAKLLPKGSFGSLMDTLSEAHGPIAHLFGNGEGLRIQRDESDIMIEVLLRLASRGITALPVHDAVIAAAPHRAQVEEVMMSVFKQRSGLVGVVSASS